MDLDSIERMTNSHNTNSSEASSNQILSQETGRRISLAHSSIESKTTSVNLCCMVSSNRGNGETDCCAGLFRKEVGEWSWQWVK